MFFVLHDFRTIELTSNNRTFLCKTVACAFFGYSLSSKKRETIYSIIIAWRKFSSMMMKIESRRDWNQEPTQRVGLTTIQTSMSVGRILLASLRRLNRFHADFPVSIVLRDARIDAEKCWSATCMIASWLAIDMALPSHVVSNAATIFMTMMFILNRDNGRIISRRGC